MSDYVDRYILAELQKQTALLEKLLKELKEQGND